MPSVERDAPPISDNSGPISQAEAPGGLNTSAESLQLAVRAAGIGVWDVNARTGERRWSPEFRAILGLAPDAEPDRDAFSALLHPDDTEWVNDIYRTVYEPGGNGSYEAEFRIIRANDKAVRWVVTTGLVTFDENGEAIRGIGTLRDIHEHRMLVEALRASEERLRVALAAGRMGIWRFDLRTGQQDWDERQYELLGVDPSVPPTRDTFLSLVHPDDLPNVEFTTADLPGPGVFLDSQFRVVKPDGTVRWITAHALTTYDNSQNPVELIGVNFDVTTQKQAEARQDFLLSELTHRVKNTLATVQAIVGQTLRNADGLDVAAENVRARLAALSNTHDLLTETDWRGARLLDIVSALLGPYGEQSVRLDGPDVNLDPKAAVALGIVFHELATNAAKYGALSTPEGRVDISWTVSRPGARILDITWREGGGPSVLPPRQQGLGTRLMEASVTGELGGTISVEYPGSGLACTLSIPLETAVRDQTA